jgi:acyl-CoA hydrolase
MDDEEVMEEKRDKQVDLVEVEVDAVAIDDEEEPNVIDKENPKEARDKDRQEEAQAENKDDDVLHSHIKEETKRGE